MNSQYKNISSYIDILVAIVVFLTAISLNILLTLRFSENHIGIRVGATDFLIPIFVTLFLSIIIKHRKIPELILKHGWVLLIIMSIWMLVSLVNGYIRTDELMTWALVNKYFGWLVLMSYFVAGVYIGTQNRKLNIYFFKVLLITTWVICIFELFSHWFFTHGFFFQFKYIAQHYRMQGLYQNPNAFGIFLSTMFILQIFALKKSIVFGKSILFVGAAITMLCVFYSYSRSSWLGLFVGTGVLLFIDRKVILYIITSFVIAYSINILAFSSYTKDINIKIIEYTYTDAGKLITVIDKIGKNISGKTIKKLEKSNLTLKKKEKKKKVVRKKNINPLTVKRLTAIDRIKSDGLSIRMEIMKRSLSYWADSPLTGIGLGVHLWNSKKEGIPDDALTIHNSAIWLLVETGIIGVLIFALFIILCIRALFLNTYSKNSILESNAMVSIIFLFIGASLATEIIYQRYFWLLLGLFLVDNIRNKTGDVEGVSNGNT